MWADGMTTAQIAIALGDGFTRDMVIGRAHRMGLPPRPSPIKRREGG
jgi:GcrA cell cycle regulator